MNKSKYSTMDIQNRILDLREKKGRKLTNIDEEFLLMYSMVAKAWDTHHKEARIHSEDLVDIAISLFSIAASSHADLGEEIGKTIDIEEKCTYKFANGKINENFDPSYLPYMDDYFMDGVK